MEENGQLVQFIFNTNKEIIAEKENEWTIYIRGSELLASSNDHARTYYHYANDEMGSITHIVDDKEILNQYEYDAWGNVTSQKATVKNRFKFNGQQLDPITQQYYLRARFYNPVVARFTQEDTYRGDGLNLYSYCANNPVYYVDPSGNVICPKKYEELNEKRKNNPNSITPQELLLIQEYENKKLADDIQIIMDKYQQLTTMYYNQHLGKGTASQIGSWTHRDVAYDIETFVNNNIGNMPFIEEVYVEQSFLNSTNRNGKGCSRPDLVIFNTLNSNVLIADIKTGKAKYGNRQKRKNEINIGTYTPSSRQNRVNVFIHQEVKP